MVTSRMIVITEACSLEFMGMRGTVAEPVSGQEFPAAAAAVPSESGLTGESPPQMPSALLSQYLHQGSELLRLAHAFETARSSECFSISRMQRQCSFPGRHCGIQAVREARAIPPMMAA